MRAPDLTKSYDWQVIANLSFQMQVSGLVGDFIRKYPQFVAWSGSHNPVLHHYGEGGLVRHTREVIELGLQNALYLKMDQKFNLTQYYLAALFHDAGKMFDYERVENKSIHGDPRPDTWEPTKHRRMIHHLPRSLMIWHELVVKYPDLEKAYHDPVCHAILAHHGQREHGSPVAPLTAEAWMLHLCDGISARMNDCDRHDVLKKPA